MLHRLYDCLNSHRMSPALPPPPPPPLSLHLSLSSTVMRFYLTLHSYSTYRPHRLYHHLHWLSTNRLSLTLTLYLCWSPPPPPLPSHHHGLFLCPLRSLSSQYQETPLHKASNYGQMAVAELLVEKGADVDARNKVRPTLPPHTHIAAASLFSRCCPFLTPSSLLFTPTLFSRCWSLLLHTIHDLCYTGSLAV